MRTYLTHVGAKALVGDRGGMQGVNFDAEGKHLTITDGHALIEIPCSVDDGDVSAILPVEAFNAKGIVGRGEQATIAVNGKVEVKGSGGIKTLDQIDGRFPRTDSVWPAEEPVFEIGIDLSLLTRVAKAIPGRNKHVKLVFRRVDGPIVFEATQSDVKGVVMPISI